MHFQEPLNEFESRLKSIPLPAPLIDRDRLMYRCGQASGENKSLPKQNNYWQLALASCLAFLFGAGIMYWNQDNDRLLAHTHLPPSDRSVAMWVENESHEPIGWSDQQLSTLRSRTVLRVSSRFEDLAQNTSDVSNAPPPPIDTPAASFRLIDLNRQWEDPFRLRDN